MLVGEALSLVGMSTSQSTIPLVRWHAPSTQSKVLAHSVILGLGVDAGVGGILTMTLLPLQVNLRVPARLPDVLADK